jgi:hypothetical protein
MKSYKCEYIYTSMKHAQFKKTLHSPNSIFLCIGMPVLCIICLTSNLISKVIHMAYKLTKSFVVTIAVSVLLLNGCTSFQNVDSDWLADNCSSFPSFYADACDSYSNCKPVTGRDTMCACTYPTTIYVGELYNGKFHGWGGYDWEDGTSFLGHWMNGAKHCGIQSKGQDYWVYRDGEVVRDGNNIANGVAVVLIAGAVAAIATSGGGGGGGGGYAPSDSDWDWDYQPSNRQWVCRGIQTGRYSQLSNCTYDVKDDNRWPN